jgi:hypothetical protein
VVEGKHYIEMGANYIKSLRSTINKEDVGVNFSISQKIIDRGGSSSGRSTFE